MNFKSEARIYSIFKKPILTEKSYNQMNNQATYSFYVDKTTNRYQIKKAFEKLFSVKVLRINIINTKSKKKRVGKYQGLTSAKKKAIITLMPNQKLNIYDEELEQEENKKDANS